MMDAFYIYTHYRTRNGGDLYVLCGEVRDLSLGLDIHGQQNFIPVEFAGAIATVLFYVSDVALGAVVPNMLATIYSVVVIAISIIECYIATVCYGPLYHLFICS